MKTKYVKPTVRSLGAINGAEGLCLVGTGPYGTVCTTGAVDANCGPGTTPGQNIPTYCTPGGLVALCLSGGGAQG